MAGVRLQGEDHWLTESWAPPVSHCCVLKRQGFQCGSREGQPACESPILILDLWCHLTGASTSNSTASPGKAFPTASFTSKFHNAVYSLLSTRNEETNIYVEKIGENSPVWVFSYLASFHSSDFGCSSTTSGLCSVFSNCPRLLLDLLIILDQDSSENLLATKNMT